MDGLDRTDASHSSAPATASAGEDSMIRQRRKLICGGSDSAEGPRRALAWSGGGIRSATFSLGVLQAITESRASGRQPAQRGGPGNIFRGSLLSTFDYLSTVSGGGYLGSFLCSLFVPGRLRHHDAVEAWGEEHEQAAQREEAMASAADDAVRVLSAGIPGRIRASNDYSGDGMLQAPLAWLRENGRYLTPSSSGDGLYAAALALRNWLAVHCVIGTLLTALVALIITARATVASIWNSTYGLWEQQLFESAVHAADRFSVAGIWWSTLSVAFVLPLATIGVGLGTAYWLVEGPDDGAERSGWTVSASVMLGLGTIAAAAVFVASVVGAVDAGTAAARRLGLLLYFGIECLLASLCYAIAIWRYATASQQRVALTRGAEMVLVLTIVLAGLAVVDTLGQTIYLVAKQGGATPRTLSPAALAIALVWLARRLSAKDAITLPAFVRRLPLSALAGITGVAIFVLVGALWAAFVHWIVWGGNKPDATALHHGTYAGAAALTFVTTLLLAFVNGFFPGFINMSSLQAFYAARLTRAYLGASNGQRFSAGGAAAALSAAEPIDSDQLRMSDYFRDGRITTLAPLHVINVTVNKTVDPAEQLVQRDRKGQPLAVLPCGIALDAPEVGPFPAPPRTRFRSSVERELDVGEWVATSGAAVSTGIGRQTSLGASLLLGAANVRLGTWWPTGYGRSDTVRIPLLPKFAAPEWIRSAVGAAFKTQRYLSYELRAAFHGTHRHWQYLSDGGHFENTGVYELLRKQRRVRQIFACDNGADPAYEFEDLANLIRLSKIDFGIDIQVVNPKDIDIGNEAFKALAGLFGTPDTFKRAAADEPPVALLLYANSHDRGPVQIVLIKPRVGGSAPADVLQYAATHGPFPQQPTADQFFDEAQWESYRALGYWQGKRVFTPGVLDALEAHAVARDRLGPHAPPRARDEDSGEARD